MNANNEGVMKYLSAISILILAACSINAPRVLQVDGAIANETEQEIIQLDDRLNDAVLHKDTEALASALAADLIYTNSTGQVSGKAEQIAWFKTTDLVFDVLTLHDRKVQVYGEVAVVNVRRIEKAHTSVNVIDEEQRVTRVYVKRQGRWSVVAAHVSRIASR